MRKADVLVLKSIRLSESIGLISSWLNLGSYSSSCISVSAATAGLKTMVVVIFPLISGALFGTTEILIASFNLLLKRFYHQILQLRERMFQTHQSLMVIGYLS